MSTPAEQLDAMVMPPRLARLKLNAPVKPWFLMDGASYRPGFNLTPQRLMSAYRQAEFGQPAMQCDMFEDLLENDGHTRGQYEARNMAVSFRPKILQPGGKDDASLAARDVLWSALKRANMLALCWHLMDAIGFGWSGANIVWIFDPKLNAVVPRHFLCAPHRRFLVDNSGYGTLRFRTIENQWPGIELEPGQWLVARRMHRQIVRAGLFRTTSWWVLFKRLSISDWIVFAEKFGIPYVLGYYNERASDASRQALTQAIQEVGEDGQAVLSDLTKMVIESAAMRSGDVAALHPLIAARCDAEISKLITGATLNVETGGPGSFALGKVHEGRATQLQFADAFWLQEAFEYGVVLPFLEYNPQFAAAEPPKLYVRVQPEMPPLERIQVYQRAQAMGAKVSGEQVNEEFGLRVPDEGDELEPLYALAPPKVPAPPVG